MGLDPRARSPSRVASTRTLTRASSSLSSLLPGHTLGDRNITVREDKAPTKSAPSKSGGNRNTLGDTPAAEGCRCYVGNLAWETTEETLIGASRDRAISPSATLGPNVARAGLTLGARRAIGRARARPQPPRSDRFFRGKSGARGLRARIFFTSSPARASLS